jgi:FkbM family methyltransferase
VHEPARFVANELRDVPSLRQYQLRGSRLLAQVRHPLLDMWGVEEMFRFRVYDPPPPVTRAMASLGRPPRIVDLGAHVGFFGLFMLRLFPDAGITSFEPDPRNVRILRRCIEANALQDRWQVVEACAATSDGTAEFSSSFHLSRRAPDSDHALDHLHRRIGGAFPFLEGSALLTAERQQVRCVDVFPFLPDADLVKMDIEGSEWEILSDSRLDELTASAVVLEYHSTDGAGADAEEFVRRALGRAGYETGGPLRADGTGVIWAWKGGGRSS